MHFVVAHCCEVHLRDEHVPDTNNGVVLAPVLSIPDPSNSGCRSGSARTLKITLAGASIRLDTDTGLHSSFTIEALRVSASAFTRLAAMAQIRRSGCPLNSHRLSGRFRAWWGQAVDVPPSGVEAGSTTRGGHRVIFG